MSTSGHRGASRLQLNGPPGGRCLVMGVLNVTPDSFSDGGSFIDAQAAIRHGFALAEQGADIVDVGGESTRPGATRPAGAVERDRVIPVIDALARAGVIVSVDTMRASVAGAALRHGAAMVNDVSGGLADAAMIPLVAAAAVPFVVMHWRAHAHEMAHFAQYRNVVGEVIDELRRRCTAALDGGISPDLLIVDPGLGFSKTPFHNWQLLAHLDRFAELGFPLLIGASRKSFLTDTSVGDGAQSASRDESTAAVSALAAAHGAWCVRVHAPQASAHAVRVVARITQARNTRQAPRATRLVRR
jgi:dihydropteroate synthase